MLFPVFSNVTSFMKLNPELNYSCLYMFFEKFEFRKELFSCALLILTHIYVYKSAFRNIF